MVGGKIGENNCDNYLPLFQLKGCLSVYFKQKKSFYFQLQILMQKCFQTVLAIWQFRFCTFRMFSAALSIELLDLTVTIELKLNSSSKERFVKNVCLVFISFNNSILFPELLWPTVRRKCSSDQEKLLKFEAEGREFAKYLRSLKSVQFRWKSADVILKRTIKLSQLKIA